MGRGGLGGGGAEPGFAPENGWAGHGHARRKQNFNGGIQPQNRDGGSAQKIWAAWLCVGAAAECQNRAFSQLRGAAERGAKLIRFDLAESRFAEAFENFRNREASGSFDAVIEIDKAPG